MSKLGALIATMPSVRKEVKSFMRKGNKRTVDKIVRAIRGGARRHPKISQLRRALPGYTNVSPFPPTKSYRLVYESDGSLSVGTSGVLGTEADFYLNSLYAPEVTSGHQCYGFDALSIAYQRYKIHGCLCEIRFYNVQTISAVECAYAVLNPSNSSNSISGADPDAVGERQDGETVILQDTGKQEKIVKFYMPMYQAFNMTKLQYKADIDNSTAAVTGNPGSQVKLVIAVADPNGGSSGGCRYKIKLTYYCQLYQRKEMAQS